ncbi:ADP-ribosylglycohydrolase family protein [Microterricola viridarii]|uniref:ADP-ribosylglycohydrolase n=1 Tax=Microterricola viridarii TaxID=412690 RepID=A0A1H1NCP9_9MICO|nr:ADP-ribosylglycohydrolase family protein [Microterricola viridarii]SDR96732.1 ADP-ribosylglycohydrolase [Microterricola viridarii]
MTTIHDRARGAIIGLAIGDAMGAPTEGMTISAIREQFGRVTGYLSGDAAGTDDTEYAVLCAQGVLAQGSALSAEGVMAQWVGAVSHQKGGFFGAGFSEMVAISNFIKGVTPPRSGQENYEQWSDGAAMRVAPIGIFALGDPVEAARLAGIDASVSHARDGIYCGQAIAAAVAVAMVSDDFEAVLAAGVAALPTDSWSHRLVTRALGLARAAGSVEEAESILYEEISLLHYPWADAGPEALALAFGLFAASKGDFATVIESSVNIGRDSDTIAAMTGAMAGAMIGYSAIPEAWSAQVIQVMGRCILSTAGTNLLELADALVELSATTIEEPARV